MNIMENKSDIIVGLDIGTTKIVCIVGRKNEHNKIDIMGVGKADSIGIAGQDIKSLQHRGIKTRANLEKEIEQRDVDALIEDMYRLVMPPGEEIIEVLPQEYIVDNEQGIKNPIGMAGV